MNLIRHITQKYTHSIHFQSPIELEETRKLSVVEVVVVVVDVLSFSNSCHFHGEGNNELS